MSDYNMKIGIIGGGFVGKATKGFGNSMFKTFVYDLNPLLCDPPSTTIEDIYKCDIVFIAVPTPMDKDGSCHTKIVEHVVTDLKEHNVEHIVVRSTVPVGTCKALGTHFMPEFLTEKNWKVDFYNCSTWVIGVNENIEEKSRQEFIDIISLLINTCVSEDKIKYSKISWYTTSEAELIKYGRNCFLATKVAFFNEIYSFCEKVGLVYNNVRDGIVIDERIGKSHSNVPNLEFFNGREEFKRGFSGTCLPKENSSMIHQFAKVEVPSPILDAVWNRNTTIDRPEKDWETDSGRAVI